MKTLFERRRQKRFWTRTTVAIIIVSVLWIITRVAFSADYPGWIVDHRTQGGGWIWFPGKATAVTERGADLMARGKALDYLIQECQIPHKEVKFHERYVVETRKGKFKVFVRASIKQEQCKEGKYGSAKLRDKIVNRPLLDIYRQYKLKIAEDQVADRVCQIDSFYCLTKGMKEIDMANWYKAYVYFDRACRMGYKNGCDMVQIVTKYLRDNDR